MSAQTIKILFDATKAETASNADWVIDEDLNNLNWNPNASIGGTDGNAQRIPTPSQSGITNTTAQSYWKGALSAWGVDCVKKGYVVESLPYNGTISYGNSSNQQDLSNYRVFVLCEPNILFTATEKTAIINFVKNGGGLFMVSDHTVSDRNNDGHDSPEILNDLMNSNTVQNNPFGITFDLANFSVTSSNMPNLPIDSILHGVMGNVTQVKWSNGTSMTINPSVNTSVKGIVYNTGSPFGNTNVMAAYARYGKGKVAAIGDSSPCDDGTGDTGDQLYDGWIADASGNHERLIMNTTIWLATIDSVILIPKIKDVKVDSILKPITLHIGIDSISLRLKNIGTVKVDSMLVSYQVNNLSIINASLKNMNFDTAKYFDFTFPIPLNIVSDGAYKLCTWVKTVGDSMANNDTLCKTFIITTSLLSDLSLDSILLPNPIHQGQSKIKIRIRNTGSVKIDSAHFYFQLNNGSIVNESTINLNLLKGMTYEYSFISPLTISNDGIYSICSWVKIQGDSILSNDTLCKIFTVNTTGVLNNLNNLNTLNQINLYPNPTISTELNIVSSIDAITKIEIADMKGTVVFAIEPMLKTKQCQINTGSFPDGLLFVKIYTDKSIVVKKIFKGFQ